MGEAYMHNSYLMFMFSSQIHIKTHGGN